MRLRPFALPLFPLVSLLAVAACTPTGDDASPDDTGDTGDEGSPFSSPDAPGPHAAATFMTTFTATTGIEETVQVWYPTDEPSPVLYSYDGLLSDTAYDNGPPACATPRPVMMFSHGSGGVRYQSTFWTEYLATHGWVVVAPDHEGNTFFDDSEDLMTLAMRRPIDVRDAYDWLLQTDAGGRLGGCVDPDAGYAMSGHSFGAYTTLVLTGTVIDVADSLAFCAENDEWLCGRLADWAAANPDSASVDLTDDRAYVGIPMAPAGYEILIGGLPDRTTPTLVWGGTRDDLTPVDTQVRPIYADLGGSPVALAILTDAGHYTFSNACDLAPIFDDCEPPFLSEAVAHPIIRTTSLAFLQRQLGSDDAAEFLPPEEPLLYWEEH